MRGGHIGYIYIAYISYGEFDGERAMMTSEAGESTPGSGSLREQYQARFAEELERNKSEQEGVRDELDRLAGRLQELEKDHDWLAGMRVAARDGQSSGGAGTEAAPAAGAETAGEPPAEETAAPEPVAAKSSGGTTARAGATPRAAVPEPRRSREAAKPRKTAATGTTAAKPKAKAKPAAPAGGAKETPAPRQGERKVTLRTAVLELLRGHREPRTAREVADEITRTHPELKTSVPVVRDALNAHVAKGLVEREARQKSVWYTAVGAAVSGAEDAGAVEESARTASDA
ncbi:hypothetical protein ABT354_02685 [Streptomyces sp. NPDC000594]|uniref:hypothetical protein n=1 Tax=Streptomyces sp. NPDC000594 TaxID=3154261 RepID=UPI0033241C8C